MLSKIKLFQELKHDRWVKPFLKRYKLILCLALILGVCTLVCASALMFTSGYLISKAATRPFNILLIYVPIVLTRTFGIGRPVFHYAERLTSHNWILKMTADFRVKLYQSLEQKAIFFKNEYRYGDILGLLSEDINHIQDLYLRTIFPTVIIWMIYIIIIVCLGFFSLLFALWMLLMLGVLIFVMPLWSMLVNGARQEYEKQLKNELYLGLTDNILGITDWVFSQRKDEYLVHHEAAQAEFFATEHSVRKFNNFRKFVGQVFFLLIVLSVIFWASQRFMGTQPGLTNWIAAFVLCLFPLEESFAALPAAAQETNVYADTLKRLNNLPEPVIEEAKEITLTAPYNLAVSHVSYHYPKSGKLILNNLSLAFKSGEKVAILGRSGSGKSTLLSLLRGDLLPDQGSITLNGHDVHQFGDQISQYIGVIQQQPYLFHTTIYGNLALGNRDITKADVYDVLKRVGLAEMIDKLPDGLDTMVDEAGLRFSGGERQRMALARILLKDVPIVLLDEPTVGLDPINERKLLNIFMDQLKDKTIIWVTHHLQGINKVDRVIFLEDGEIEMAGSPADLQATSEHYRQLKAADQGRV